MGSIRADAPILRRNNWIDAAANGDEIHHLTLCQGDGTGELPPPPPHLPEKKPGGGAASGVSVRDRVRTIEMRTNGPGPSTAAKPALARPAGYSGAFSGVANEMTQASPIAAPSPEERFVRYSRPLPPPPSTASKPHLRPPILIENAVFPQGTTNLCLRHGRYGSRSA